MKHTEILAYANFHGYSDVEPFEVIRKVSDKCVEVRAMKATLLNGVNSGAEDALTFEVGGFCGHTSGQQRYTFESQPDSPARRIRLGKKGWKDANGGCFVMSAEPFKYYDFNF